MKYLNLQTLKHKRFRGGMFETFKIINNKNEKLVLDLILNKLNHSRGHSF